MNQRILPTVKAPWYEFTLSRPMVIGIGIGLALGALLRTILLAG